MEEFINESLEGYLNEEISEKSYDISFLKERFCVNIFQQMIDVWAEANHAIQLLKDSKEAKLKQLKALHDICCYIYLNADVDQGLKYELKIAEWQLCDFLVGNNRFKFNKNNIMNWFNQWCYDINYDLLKEG